MVKRDIKISLHTGPIFITNFPCHHSNEVNFDKKTWHSKDGGSSAWRMWASAHHLGDRRVFGMSCVAREECCLAYYDVLAYRHGINSCVKLGYLSCSSCLVYLH